MTWNVVRFLSRLCSKHYADRDRLFGVILIIELTFSEAKSVLITVGFLDCVPLQRIVVR